MTLISQSKEELLPIKEIIFFNLTNEQKNRIETHYSSDKFLEQVFHFCLDDKGDVRLSVGMVAFSPEYEYDPNYVPKVNFGPCEYDYTHENFTLNLPNPSQNLEQYQTFRAIILQEIENRMEDVLSNQIKPRGRKAKL